MKKINLLFAIVLVVSTMTGSFAQNKKVAVATFSVNKLIKTGNLGEDAAAIKSLLELSENPSFNMKPSLEKFHEVFFRDYAKEFPFELLPKETVTGNERYKNYRSTFDKEKVKNYDLVDGYHMLERTLLGLGDDTDRKTMTDIFAHEANGVMFVYLSFEFNKTTVMGNGIVRVKASVNMVTWNKDNKKVFDIFESSNSGKTAAMVNGIPIMTPEKIGPLCEDAIEKLIEDLKKKLPKIAKKTEAKL